MSTPFFRIQKLETTNSTNTVVMDAAIKGEAEGLVVCADQQTAGRGRRGRAWESPKGNLYTSVLLRPCCSPQEACYYSFAAAMAVFYALAELGLGKNMQMKWPNDVLLNDKKVSGVLLEAAPVENGIVEWIALGVGINIASCPSDALYPATSLADEGLDVTVDRVLDGFLRALDHWRLTLKYDGFNPLRVVWLADAKRGAMSVKMPHQTLEGDFGGLDSSGGLILMLADGSERVIQAGDVFFS